MLTFRVGYSATFSFEKMRINSSLLPKIPIPGNKHYMLLTHNDAHTPDLVAQ